MHFDVAEYRPSCSRINSRSRSSVLIDAGHFPPCLRVE